MRLVELAAQLGCTLEGDGSVEVLRVSPIEQAGPGDITFLANTKYIAEVKRTRASAVIAGAEVQGAPCAVLRTNNPYLAFARAVGLLNPQPRPSGGIHPTAIIAADVAMGDDVSVGPYVVIGSGARIGARSVLHPHVVIGAGATLGDDCYVHARASIRERVSIGARCVIQDGAVIGSDGFGFAHRDDGTHEKIPQVATVVIEDEVEIGANTTIDRPAVGETRIKRGTKIDNLVQIAHGVVVGSNTLLAAQVGVAGSSVIGDDVMLGGQVGVTGHVTVGDRAKASAKTGITGNVSADAFITGYPHMDNLAWRKAYAVFRRLPELRKQLNELQLRLAKLEGTPTIDRAPMTKPLLRLAIFASLLTSVVFLAPAPRAMAATGLSAVASAAPDLSAVALAKADVRPPKLTYERIKLPNGLTVLLHQDRSTPIAHVQLWYHVGSKDERAGRTGFAHLFEHMMFKGSKNVEPEQHTSIVSSVGGQANAYTTEDSTVYWQTVPAQYLPLVLWMEGDRMATLRIDERTFRNEREVVKEERRMRIENQPYGRLNEILFAQAFAVHPYRHPVIGSMQDLEAATIDDVRDFYRTYYVPSNCTIVIAGDFDMPQVKELVDRYLARVPPAAQPVPRDIPKEPLPSKEKRVTVTEPWPLPAVVVGYHITYDGHPDAYPLHIASKVLSDGQSSRIYRKLVYETGQALTAFGGANLIEHPNLFYAVAIVNPGQSPAAVEKTLIGELERLKTESITAHELQRSKNQFARDYILGRESLQQKSLHLAHAEVLHSDITTADGEFDIFQNISLADVQRVANTYFTPDRRIVLHVMPKGGGR